MGSGEIYQNLTLCPPRLFRELVMKESPGTADVECKSLSSAGPRPRPPLVSDDNLAGTMAPGHQPPHTSSRTERG